MPALAFSPNGIHLCLNIRKAHRCDAFGIYPSLRFQKLSAQSAADFLPHDPFQCLWVKQSGSFCSLGKVVW